MANKVILDTAYTFTPSTRTIVIPKYVARERLIEIVDVTNNHTLYQRYEPVLSIASYTTTSAGAGGTDSTTIVLTKDTTSGIYASTDKLQITIDESNVSFAPAETQTDPTNKMRVTTPQALIDTDFEYGTQVSKWENLAHTNFRPFAYASATTVAGITAIAPITAGKRAVRVSLPSTAGLAVGDPISVQDTLSPIANGVFVIDAINSNVSFDYTARAAFANTNGIFDTYRTIVTKGNLYTNAQIGGALTLDITATPIIKVTTTTPHGLSLGNEIEITGITGTNPPNGAFVVSSVSSPLQFQYVLDADAATPSGLTTTLSKLYVRPQGSVLHRPYDGGVIFSSNGSSNYETTTRQTRRYFRYQSGKGIMFSSGTILKPNFQLDTLSYATATNLVTVVTKDQHNLQTGSTIVVSGANESLFNGTVTVYSVLGYNKFTYTPTTTSGSDINASGTYYASITTWYGAVNRLGIFDQQNGLLFEYDGSTLYAVRRNSTYQIAGRVDVTSGSNNVTANVNFNTAFSKQLTPGDYIVIRGQSYRVDSIISDNALTISPSYRGADDVVAAIVSKTIDTKFAQSQWNIDKMDGTGPSGYNLDLSRMQMFYIDYSWYGAGFIRWGLRGANGDVTYVHKMQNNNVNFEAYMRSGNLPGRYESTTQPPKAAITSVLGSGSTAITVPSTAGFPSSGTLVVKGLATTSPQAIQSSSGNGSVITHTASGVTFPVGTVIQITGCSIPGYNGVFVVTGLSSGTSFTVAGKTQGSSTGGSAGTTVSEYINYTGTTATTFTGLTRAQAGVVAGTTVTMNVGDNSGTVSSASGIQIGQRVISKTSTAAFPDGTYVTAINGTTIAFSQALTGSKANPANPTVIFQPMGTTVVPTVYPFGATAPGAVELAFPTFAPTISHWGTSVIMDGRFDDDKSLLFTYGQTTSTNLGSVSGTTATTSTTGAITANTTNVTIASNTNVVVGQTVTTSGGTGTLPAGTTVSKVTSATSIQLSASSTANFAGTETLTFSGATSKALFSVRIAPSVDNGKSASFGQRDLTNRMQLVLRALDIALQGSTSGNLLVTAVLNGKSTTSTTWSTIPAPTSSLAQVADYSSAANGNATTITNGEITGGFFVNSTNSVDLSLVRDLGNSIFGGGGTTSDVGIYPDGPDVLTIVVQNLAATTTASVVGRLSWTEAQA